MEHFLMCKHLTLSIEIEREELAAPTKFFSGKNWNGVCRVPFSCKHTCLYFGVRTLSNAPPPSVCPLNTQFSVDLNEKVDVKHQPQITSLSACFIHWIKITICPLFKLSVSPKNYLFLLSTFFQWCIHK